MEEANYDKEGKSKIAGGAATISQLSIFDARAPKQAEETKKAIELLKRLEDLDVNALSPIEALNVLNELKKGEE